MRVIHIIDDGETAIGQSLRVHLKYRRQGIGKRLIQECRNYVKKNFAIQKKSDDVLFYEAIFFACLVNSNESELSSWVSNLSTDQCCELPDKMDFEQLFIQGVTHGY